MRHTERENHADDGLEQLGARLRATRPRLSGLELDAVQQRVRARTARSTKEGGLMKSRIAVLTMLVAGLLFSTTGAGLAVTGLAADDQASVAQYGQNAPDDVAGDIGTTPDADVQAGRQTQFNAGDSDDQLPFTGFAAIPLLILGVGLLGGGMVLRRRGTA